MEWKLKDKQHKAILEVIGILRSVGLGDKLRFNTCFSPCVKNEMLTGDYCFRFDGFVPEKYVINVEKEYAKKIGFI